MSALASGPETKVAIIGTTTWGTTLGIVLARRDVPVTLWARTAGEAETLARDRQNVLRLPDYDFPPAMRVTASAEEALAGAGIVLFAVPSRSLRENVRAVRERLDDSMLIVSATKGLERDTAKRMSQVLAEELTEGMRRNICVLSGPNLAREIVDGHPASTVVAAADEPTAARVVKVVMSPLFRAYTNTDVIGVELGGALKNVVAIGAGMSDGLGFGDNAKAAFINRGLVEITRLGVAAGARPLTFAGLACLGDLIATCSSRLSRNYYVGEQLAKGRPLKAILESMRNVAEGVDTTVAALRMAADLGVEMPITTYTHKVLFEGMEPEQAVTELMARSPKSEWEGVAERG
ncbi:MAG: NAD(P)-dependent glycerol-3-phosphate dehydrogenase [Chloroflexi bacterium]|nr:NAD(P)-dependent glycerol-3-phosphate dehydrogenase [Chloroflexota bacterium]